MELQTVVGGGSASLESCAWTKLFLFNGTHLLAGRWRLPFLQLPFEDTDATNTDSHQACKVYKSWNCGLFATCFCTLQYECHLYDKYSVHFKLFNIVICNLMRYAKQAYNVYYKNLLYTVTNRLVG